MTEQGKREYESQKVSEILSRWKTATMSELQWAAERCDGAILLIIARMGSG